MVVVVIVVAIAASATVVVDTEVSHCCVSKDYDDVSSDSHRSMAASTSLLSGERLMFGTTRGWQSGHNAELFLM